eukprot:CAMPEP_0201906484 /NCGR_PEP_ID=MMETSP0902-20130614/57046_1 /ASSEMBLY_ACC=CAM_ASM_000551 /TAXON_ID=420261 /ORGANISM="Thalassiosira antarctica, Strain CCMP982" /LENGTH=450 /DNA_ID=CAMNT_0048440623 /DNA_START=91 /DNA_END=1443 /DNA_ORIENTATION=-
MTEQRSLAGSDVDWLGPTGTPGSLERLCSISLRACQLMNPLIAAIYQQLVSSNQRDGKNAPEKSTVKKVKQDNSAFTIADGMVQRLLIKVLFSQIKFRDIVGEEEEEHDEGKEKEDDNTDEWWSQVEGLTIPQELRPLVDSTRSELESLAGEYLSPDNNNSGELCNHYYERLTVFIDPIDGTREFSSGKGEQCSVCIGFADEHGKSVGGVVYRPLSLPKPTWVAGAKSERYAVCDFGEKQIVSTNNDKDGIADGTFSADKMGGSLLSSNGSISPFVESLIEELKFERVKSGGAGNKMMMLLENSISGNDVDGSMLYIQDRGVSRWDTCAAEAILESFGGKLMKLTHFVESKEEEEKRRKQKDGEFYTYLASQTNLDFIPGTANLTKYNCRASPAIDLQPNQKALDVDRVKPYSNLCGLVALGREWNTIEGTIHIKEAMRRAATRNPPSFD